MESFVKQLLKDADLTVVTKKHVRMKYKEHVCRELSPEEKSKINDMVYAFVKELSAAVQQKSTTTDAPVTILNSKEESPGNKENEQSNQKPTSFIIKGQVVDRNDLYKSKSKEKEKTSPHEKQKGDEVRRKNEVSGENRSEKPASSKQHASAAKLRINEVMSAVLGCDKGESSSEVSSVSSLTETSLSEAEEEPEVDEHIHEALQKLKAARDKKIQMSIEKKNKNNKKDKGNKSSRARRSLAMGYSTLKDPNASEDSEAISIISVSSVTSETAQDTVIDNEIKKDKKIKTSVKHLTKTDSDCGELNLKKTPKGYVKRKGLSGAIFDNMSEKKKKLDSDSGELKVKRTPKGYDKRKALTGAMFDNFSEKKKKLVKRKRKKVENNSESDSDSGDDKLSLKQRETDFKKKSMNNKKAIVLDDDTDSDSENETLDKIAAKKTVKHVSTKSEPEKENDVVNKKGKPISKNSSKKSEEELDSDSGTGNTPLAKKKAKMSELDSDSEHSTGNTPLVRKKMKQHSLPDTGSESETCGTSIASKSTERATGKIRKKGIDKEEVKIKMSKNSIKETDLSKGKENSRKFNDTESKLSENRDFQELSESSSGDTPLAQIKKNKKTISESVETEHFAAKNKTKAKKSLGCDFSGSTGDAALVQKKKQKLTRSHDLKTDGKPKPKESISKKPLENSMCVIKKESDDLKTLVVKQTQEGKRKEDITLSAKRKRRLSESSYFSTGENSAMKKGKRQKLENKSMEETDSDLSNGSTVDTSLVKKTFRLRNDKTNAHLDISETGKDQQSKSKKSSEKMVDTDTQNSDSCKSGERVKALPDETHESDANCDNTTEYGSTLKVIRGHCKTSARLESSSEEESSVKRSTRNKRSVKKKFTPDSQVNGTSSLSELTNEEASSDTDTHSDSDDVPLAQIRKQPMKTKVSDLSSDSEDDIPLSKTKAAQSKQTDTKEKSKKEPSGPMSDTAYVRLLRHICRECQMFVRNDRELVGCDTDKDKIEKMEQMLRSVGMKGKPSLKKAEEVKLMKEAKELSADNIISSETGRVMRKVKSIWARRTISPVKPAKRKGEDTFASLKDIVDSEGTESG